MAFGRGTDDKEHDKQQSGSVSNNPSLSTGAATAVTGPSGEKVLAFLGNGSKVVGSLTFNGPVELDGYIEGEISSQDKLIVGESAVVNAKISGAEILVKGTVNGDISASKRLSLKRPARVVGNITCTNLSIEEGVIFEGKSTMGGSNTGSTKGAEIKSVGHKPIGSEKSGSEKIGISA